MRTIAGWATEPHSRHEPPAPRPTPSIALATHALIRPAPPAAASGKTRSTFIPLTSLDQQEPARAAGCNERRAKKVDQGPRRGADYCDDYRWRGVEEPAVVRGGP